MKNIVKNILIISELFIILFLSSVVIYLYWFNDGGNAVQTMGLIKDNDKNDDKEIEINVDMDEIEKKIAQNYYETSGKKILIDEGGYGEIMIPVVDSVPAFSKNREQIKSRNGRKYYVDNSGISSLLGVDVSVHQDDIDWEKVKNAGISFAMVRLGYRGYGTGEAKLDEKYIENVKGAREAGLDAGVYFFSQAITAKEAFEEAELVIKSLDGLDVNYPVVFDWELISDDSARTDDISVDTLTDCCVAFCETIKNAGYIPMIYQNKRTSIFKLDLNRIKEYEFWLAEYNDEPSYYYDFSMWQYTSSGIVPGIEGKVDMNIAFKDYKR